MTGFFSCTEFTIKEKYTSLFFLCKISMLKHRDTNMKWFYALLATGVMTVTTGAHAQDDGFDGWYVGGSGGYSWQSVNETYFQHDLTGSFPFNSYTVKSNLKQNVAEGQLFAGYSVPFNDILYGGLEASFNFYGSPAFYRPMHPYFAPEIYVNERVGQSYGFQFSMLPGVFATMNTLLYGRIGYGLENYKSEFNTNIPFLVPQNIQVNKWVSEIIAGFGINHYISTCMSLRLEYNHIASAKIGGPAGLRMISVTPPVLVPLFQYSNSYRLHSNNILLGLVYSF